MPLEVRTSRIRHVTVRAFVWLFASMTCHVVRELILPQKTLLADTAFVRQVAAVHPFVACQVLRLCETLRTFVTFVWFHARMSSHVTVEMLFFGQNFDHIPRIHTVSLQSACACGWKDEPVV